MIKGNTKNNANVSINGNSMIVSNGNFSFYFNLNEGNNTINITARDYLGNINLTRLNVILDTKIPLTILEPLNNTITNNRTILIKGNTKNNANVSINGNFTISTINGNFSFYLNLNEENNILNITARDYLGNTNSAILSVILDIEAPKIIWINYSNTIKIYKTFRFALNITDNINLTYVSANTKLDDITENVFMYYVDGYYIINIEPTRTGDCILNIKACDSVGNCNESGFGFYAYRETSEDTTPTHSTTTSPTTQPPVQVAIQNITNETKGKEVIVKILNSEGYTLGLAKFNTTENIFSYTPRDELWFINGTIIYPNNKTFNGSVEIEFINRIEIEEKNITFEVKNGNPNSEVRKTLENVSSQVKENYVVPSEELHNEGNIIKTKANISEEIRENETYETEIKDENGNLIKNADVEITLPNGEKIKVKTDEEGKVKLTTKNGKTEQIEKGKIKLSEQIEKGKIIKLSEQIKEGDVYEVIVRDNKGNLIKDSVAEITLPNGEKIKVRTDKNGKVKLMQKDGKIEQINAINIKIPYIEENKSYDIKIRDENWNLIKNSNVSVLLPNGQILNVLTDENGKVKLQYKDGSFAQEKQEFEFRWYYLLPLFLIPLLLYLVFKEDVILSYEFYKKLKEEKKLREIEKYGKKYMLKKYSCEVNDIKVIFVDSESEEEVAKKLKLQILK
ncbi:MAG: hypothetical protein QMD06_03020 [Candidatus Altarchaeum sp.]|nr:hypothetical protein [Candidatus Altarchaeum sp.]